MRTVSHKLHTAAGWLLGASCAAALLAPGSANAGVTCSDPLTADGGGTVLTAADATACTFSSITGSSSVAANEYWEFHWPGTGDGDITGTVVATGGSFAGDLALYTTRGSLIGDTGGQLTADTIDFTYTGALTDQAAGDYVVGLEGSFYPSSLNFNISLNATAAPTGTPEPASLGLLGSALAAFGLLRRRKHRPV